MADNIEKEKLELEVQEAEVNAREFLLGMSPLRRNTFVVLLILIIPIFFIAKYTVYGFYISAWSKNKIIVQPSTAIQLPIKILDAKVLPISGNNYSAYALIKNQNSDLVAAQLNYTFHFIDSSGAEIRSSNGSTFLNAGEQKYVIIPRVILNTVPAKVQVDVVMPIWSKRINIPNVILNASTPNYNDDQNGFFVEGGVTNNSIYTLQTLKISALVFDANSNIIAVSEVEVNTVVPKETRNYHIAWPIPLKANTSFVKVIPETNIFDSNNLQ